MKALNKKLVVSMMLMCSMMSASTMTPVGAAQYTTPTIVIDSRTIDSDTAPFIVDGTTLVPLRVISENMGASVDWNGETRKVTVKKGNTNIQLGIDDNLAYVNGDALTIALAPRIENSRTMVPLRFIGETLDCEVGWDAETKTVYITTNGEAAEQPLIEQAQNDTYGRAIRTTNLPSNADMFPYIAEEIPNWAYETQAKSLKNNYWGPSYYPETDFKGATAKELVESGSSSSPILGSNGVYELVDKFANLQTNIDYNTIGDSWVKDMLSCFSDTEMSAWAKEWTNDPIKTVEEDLKDYMSRYKAEHTVTTGEVRVMPEAIWEDSTFMVHVPVYVKYTINNIESQAEKIQNINYGNTGAVPAKEVPTSFTVGQTYEAVVTYTLTKDSKGDWKIAWAYSDIDSQLAPDINLTDGCKSPSPNQMNSFEYGYLKKGTKVNRYEHVLEDQLFDGYNMITGKGGRILVND